MVGRIKRARRKQVSDVAAWLGASVNAIDETNAWDVFVGGRHIGIIRYEPRARVWLARAGKETTLGDLKGCLRFVIRRY